MRPFLFLSLLGLLGLAATNKSALRRVEAPHEYFAVVINAATRKPVNGVQASVTQLDVSRTVRTESNGRFSLDVVNEAGLHIRLMAWGYTPVEYDRTPYCSWPDTLAITPAPPSIHQLPNGY